MAEGMYASPKRVERDGYLVAFEGEVMGMEEAARRGLLPEDEPVEAKPAPRRRRKAGK